MKKTKNEIRNGLIYVLIAFPLLFIAPIIITVGLKAIKHYHNFILVIVGIILGIIAAFLLFKGIQFMLNGFFNKSDE